RGSAVRQTLPYVMRFSGLWIFITILIVAVFGLTSYLLLSDQISEAGRVQLATVLSVQTGFAILAVLLLGVFTTHRLAGPMIAIRRALEDVKAGNLDRELHFRRTDPHLGEIEAAFNEMMETLRERGKSSAA
ncbi:MAG TPA: methyl-accepting chemotaxis protein, partial [Thermoanaerobaculia bacterium]|nr:methyl-accepting chemotaxis protein [Thermoanaerobaculia bacterium]